MNEWLIILFVMVLGLFLPFPKLEHGFVHSWEMRSNAYSTYSDRTIIPTFHKNIPVSANGDFDKYTLYAKLPCDMYQRTGAEWMDIYLLFRTSTTNKRYLMLQFLGDNSGTSEVGVRLKQYNYDTTLTTYSSTIYIPKTLFNDWVSITWFAENDYLSGGSTVSWKIANLDRSSSYGSAIATQGYLVNNDYFSLSYVYRPSGWWESGQTDYNISFFVSLSDLFHERIPIDVNYTYSDYTPVFGSAFYPESGTAYTYLSKMAFQLINTDPDPDRPWAVDDPPSATGVMVWRYLPGFSDDLNLVTAFVSSAVTRTKTASALAITARDDAALPSVNSGTSPTITPVTTSIDLSSIKDAINTALGAATLAAPKDITLPTLTPISLSTNFSLGTDFQPITGMGQTIAELTRYIANGINELTGGLEDAVREILAQNIAMVNQVNNVLVSVERTVNTSQKTVHAGLNASLTVLLTTVGRTIIAAVNGIESAGDQIIGNLPAISDIFDLTSWNNILKDIAAGFSLEISS